MIHQKLAHLSPTDLDALIARYYAGEKIAKLIAEYRIDAMPGGLVNLFPPVIHPELFCPYCEAQNLAQKRRSRDIYSHEPPKCFSCGHSSSPQCSCRNCRLAETSARDDEEKRKRAAVTREYINWQRACPEPSALTLREAVYILSLVRHSLDERLAYASPFYAEPLPIAPTHDLQMEIVKHLYSKAVIIPSPESPMDSFVFNDEITATKEYYPKKVLWAFLPGSSNEQKRKFLGDLESLVQNGEWPETWHADCDALWRLICKEECIEYFLYLLEQRDFELEEIGPKTHNVFEGMLKAFSVAQVYNLTWQAVRDTTDYIVKTNLPRYHAKNTFIGAVQRKADKFVAEGWEVRASRRDFNRPQTVLSSTFFDVFLGLGGQAFEMVPPTLAGASD